MKPFLYTLFLIILSCGTPKKETLKATENNKPVQVSKKDTHQLIAVLKYPNRLEDAKALITNSGLKWEKLLVNTEITKIALLQVPIEKQDFWIKTLKKSEEFSIVKTYSIQAINNLKNTIKNTLVSVRKTPCRGHCAVYEFTVDINGKARYNGIQYVLVKGIKEFQLTAKEFSTLKEKLTQTHFKDYQKEYNNPKLMDVPSTYITHNNKEVQLRVWKNVPIELSTLTEYLEDLLLDRKFYEQ